MENSTKKLVCFADETGQDTKGRFFLVVTCTIDASKVQTYEDLLQIAETKSGKKCRKWTNCSNTIRIKFINYLISSGFPLSTIAYSIYSNSLEYTHLISYTLAKAILRKVINTSKYSVKIFFDRVNKKVENGIKIELKKLKVRYKKIRGLKDESSALIRMTDSLAGFLRDSNENQIYTKKYLYFTKRILRL